jgi:hypothetical protein
MQTQLACSEYVHLFPALFSNHTKAVRQACRWHEQAHEQSQNLITANASARHASHAVCLKTSNGNSLVTGSVAVLAGARKKLVGLNCEPKFIAHLVTEFTYAALLLTGPQSEHEELN